MKKRLKSYFCIITIIFLFGYAIQSCKAPVKRILILGNSITHHGPVPKIGWNGNWGMAATELRKDFVHVLMDTLVHAYPNFEFDYKAINIAAWEQNFNFDFSSELNTKNLEEFNPDLLIIRLGENITPERAKHDGYEKALSEMIAKFKAPDTKVLITGNFWTSAYKDSIQNKVAVDNGYSYIGFFGIDLRDNNRAVGQFKDAGVANHPSDKGMKEMALGIFAAIKEKDLLN